MVFKETFILFFKSSLMQLMKFARDTRLYFCCLNRARSVVTPLRQNKEEEGYSIEWTIMLILYGQEMMIFVNIFKKGTKIH